MEIGRRTAAGDQMPTHSEPFLKTKGIDVVVRDGTAILSGTVQDQDSLRIAIVDAYQAGVNDVVSELELAVEQ